MDFKERDLVAYWAGMVVERRHILNLQEQEDYLKSLQQRINRGELSVVRTSVTFKPKVLCIDYLIEGRSSRLCDLKKNDD